jgi:chromate transport protein ChrA
LPISCNRPGDARAPDDSHDEPYRLEGGWAGRCTRLRGRDIRPSCTAAFVVFRLGHRFRDAPWQRIVLRGLVPVTVGIVIASGYVLARAADSDWQAMAITAAAAGLMLGTRINPLWVLATAGAVGGFGAI